MIRAGALLLLLATVAVGASGCVLAPVPGPVIGPPVVVAPRPVIVAPRPYYYPYYRGGYYRGYHRGYGHWH